MFAERPNELFWEGANAEFVPASRVLGITRLFALNSGGSFHFHSFQGSESFHQTTKSLGEAAGYGKERGMKRIGNQHPEKQPSFPYDRTGLAVPKICICAGTHFLTSNMQPPT